ncbi:MAG TPA: hypothetical protein VF817_01655 [Patescibacteria group bacterium]
MRNKKIIIGGVAVLVAVLLFSIVAVLVSREYRSDYGYRRNGNYDRMMNGGNGYYMMSQLSAVQDNFIAPQDAAKTGELAIIVGNLDTAKQAVTEIASRENGSIYATRIEYSSNDIKNGSIVVGVPLEKFDDTFSQLKTVARQVVQESTSQVSAAITPKPQPLAVDQTQQAASDAQNVDKETAVPTQNETQAVISKPLQEKGYIRVVFADYGNRIAAAPAVIQSSGELADVLGVGYRGQDLRNNPWVVLAIKSILLVVLIALLVVLLKKSFTHWRGSKVKRHVILAEKKAPAKVMRRQASKVQTSKSKTRPRVVKLKKK